MLIAFTGLKGSGKDTATRAFTDVGFEHVKMAGALKLMLRSMLDYQGASAEQMERMIDGDEKELDSFLLAGRSPRHAMQTLGTEWGRKLMAEDIWVQMTLNRLENLIRQGRDIVISDIRFENEVSLVKSLGGEVWRIERHGVDSADLHPSEAKIMELEVTGVIPNTVGTADKFKMSVFHLFGLADHTPAIVRQAPANDRETAEQILTHFRPRIDPEKEKRAEDLWKDLGFSPR